MSGRRQARTRQVISHAHARMLAECWQDAERPGHPITVLAASGTILPDTELSLRHDLRLLEMASASWGSPRTIPEKQLSDLLAYVLHHQPRGPLPGWSALRDADFVASIRRMASEVRAHEPMVYEPPVDRVWPHAISPDRAWRSSRPGADRHAESPSDPRARRP